MTRRQGTYSDLGEDHGEPEAPQNHPWFLGCCTQEESSFSRSHPRHPTAHTHKEADAGLSLIETQCKEGTTSVWGS